MSVRSIQNSHSLIATLFILVVLLCVLLTSFSQLLSGVSRYPVKLYILNNEINHVVCDDGMQATFIVNGQSFESPRVQTGQNWQQKVDDFSSNVDIPVAVKAYCYRNDQEAGYVEAEVQVQVSSPESLLGISAPFDDSCDGTKHGWIKAVDPVPCVGATDLAMPTPIILVLDTEDTSVNVCDEGLQITALVESDSLTSPLLAAGERWVGSVGKLEVDEPHRVTLEAYCYLQEQEPGHTKVTTSLSPGLLGPITVYTSEPSTTNRSCISNTAAAAVEVIEPSPCISYVSPRR